MKKIVLLCLTIILISYNYLFGFSAGFMGSGAAKNAGAPAGFTDFTDNANCQAAYLFNDDLTDESGEGNTLTDGVSIVYSTTRPTQYSTPQGKSADFEAGDSDYLSRADADVSANFPGQATKTDFSVSFWVKYESLSCNYGIIGKKLTDSWGIANLWNVNRCSMRMYIYDGTDGVYVTLQENDDTDWHHVVVAFHGGSNHIHLYMSSDGGTFGDEQLHDDVAGTPIVLTNVDSAWANANDFTIGAYSGGNFLDGLIYQPIVFDDLLTAAEAQSIYENGITGNDG